MKINSDEIIESTIHGIKINFYVVPEENLKTLSNDSIYNDIFYFLSSLLGGGVLSLFLSNKIDKFFYLLLILFFIVFIIGISFTVKKYSKIKDIKASSFSFPVEKE